MKNIVDLDIIFNPVTLTACVSRYFNGRNLSNDVMNFGSRYMFYAYLIARLDSGEYNVTVRTI